MEIILVMAVICGFVGYAIGKPKGHGSVGAVLGGVLGLLGLIIVAVMKPAEALPPGPDASR